MNQLLDYVIALTHLYGIVHKDKVLEIYNMQNKTLVTAADISNLLHSPPSELKSGFVMTQQDYFVHTTIVDYDEFDEQLKQRRGKPYYVPDKEELMRYKKDTYFETNAQYVALCEYLTKNLLDGDEIRADNLASDIQGYCQFDFNTTSVFKTIDNYGVVFENDEQVHDVLQLIQNLANNTRLQENNGHTPQELFLEHEKPYLRTLPKFELSRENKTGRNDPCPCGSGKKYKKCCLANQY